MGHASWRTAASTAPVEERLDAWINDVLRPILDGDSVDELEWRVLEASWWAYGLPAEGDDVAKCSTLIGEALVRRDNSPPEDLALQRLLSARGDMTLPEREALDMWAERIRRRGFERPRPSAVGGGEMDELLKRVATRPLSEKPGSGVDVRSAGESSAAHSLAARSAPAAAPGHPSHRPLHPVMAETDAEAGRDRPLRSVK
jgi:hypothetical protein